MKINQKIMWQKYEDVLHEQLDSPILNAILDKNKPSPSEESDYLAQERESEGQMMFPMDDTPVIDEKTLENISLSTNFDCWMGHTNFNITSQVVREVCKTEGVEVFKVCSRYRFFIGVGRMFSFSDVRQQIEKLVIKGD